MISPIWWTDSTHSRNASEPLPRGFERAAELLPEFNAITFARHYGGDSQPPNVLKIGLRIFEEEDDMPEGVWAEKILALVNQRQKVLVDHGVRRVPIMICRKGQYPLYFTLRDMGEA